MERRVVIASCALVAVAGVTPALAQSAAAHRVKTIKGTWSFRDVTPDPYQNAAVYLPGKDDTYCHGGVVPASPADRNVAVFAARTAGKLVIDGNNVLDWAMELDDAHGIPLAGTDEALPQEQERLVVRIPHAGAYRVLFCNLGGAPTATATYTFKYR